MFCMFSGLIIYAPFWGYNMVSQEELASRTSGTVEKQSSSQILLQGLFSSI